MDNHEALNRFLGVLTLNVNQYRGFNLSKDESNILIHGYRCNWAIKISEEDTATNLLGKLIGAIQAAQEEADCDELESRDWIYQIQNIVKPLKKEEENNG